MGSWRFVWCCQVAITTTKITIDFSLAYLVTSSKQIAPCGKLFGGGGGRWGGGRVVRGYRSASDFIHLFCALLL